MTFEPGARVRVVTCRNGYAHHVGVSGSIVGPPRYESEEGLFMVDLDGPIDSVFGTTGLWCTATKVEAER